MRQLLVVIGVWVIPLMEIEVAHTTVIEAIATDLTAITGQVTPGIRIIIGIHPIAIRGTAIPPDLGLV